MSQPAGRETPPTSDTPSSAPRNPRSTIQSNEEERRRDTTPDHPIKK